MRGTREISAFIALLFGYVIQTSVIARLNLPMGGPNLVLVLFLVWALRHEAITAALVGFVVGLLLDLAPPGGSTVGVWMIVLTAVGYGVGSIAANNSDFRDSPVIAWLAVVAGLAFIFVGRFIIGISVGEAQLNFFALFKLLVGGLLWNSLLAPVALWFSKWMYATLSEQSDALR